MRRIFICLGALSVSVLAAAEVPPLRVPIGEMVEGVVCASDPTQTYTLYLPPSFTNDRRWPVLLIFDPRGRSVLAAEIFREAADTYGWIIVSSNDTRSDGPMAPNIVALRALWPEVHIRLPADSDRIYAAGFSGGGAVAYVLSRSTHGLAGIVACGARFLPDDLEGNSVPIFASAGNTDFNYHEMHLLDAFLEEQGNPHRLLIFDGPHTWMPPSAALKSVEWLELVAIKRGLREPDPELVASLFTADLKTARALGSGGRLLEAGRTYREMERTYAGLRDVSEVGQAAEDIEASPEYRRQRKDHRRWDGFEREYLGNMNRRFAELRSSEIPPPVRRLALDFRVEELQRRARDPGYEGVVARRSLNALTTGLSFYLPRDFVAAGQYDRLAASLELALKASGDNPVLWYNLACARARLGRGDLAMEALASALEAGFDRTELLASDEDLDSLRGREDFKALLASTSR